LEEEVQAMIGKDIPAASLSIDKRLVLVKDPSAEGFLCPFLKAADNKCQIYSARPFECQLYPFLLNLRGKKAVLTLDLNCPYIRENMHSPQLKEYSRYLEEHLNSPAQLRMLKENPQILQAYEEVLEVVELNDFNDAH
jgi:Fe-S-cluster containining protein